MRARTTAVLLVGVTALLAGYMAWRAVDLLRTGRPTGQLLGVGVLGGYTTFSSFTLETVNMAQRGEWIGAAAYVAVSVVGSIVALVAGLAAMRVAAA